MSRILVCALLSLAALLAGCEITVLDGEYTPDGVSIANATYHTDYLAEIDGVERFVICDDRVTTLGYSFDYEGPLARWTSFLRGVLTGDVIGRRTFTPTDSGVSYGARHVRVTYAIYSGVAPLDTDHPGTESARTQSIRVVPLPEVLGYTHLYLELDGAGSARQLVSRAIPVLASCAIY